MSSTGEPQTELDRITRDRANAALLKRMCRFLLKVIRETPDGISTMGRLSLQHPDLMGKLMEVTNDKGPAD